jgi:serine protease AprX
MKKFSILIIFLISSHAFAQNKYLVLFKDKNNSTYSTARAREFLSERSIKRREKQRIALTERDLPPNGSYLNEIRKTGAKVIYQSRWLNGALIETNATNLTKILLLPFVKGLEGKGDIRNTRLAIDKQLLKPKEKFETIEINDNGRSQGQLAMLGADIMHERGYKGEGMLIGILDSGFLNADKLSFFKPIFDEKRVLATYDFVVSESNVYDDDSHGTAVFSCIGAFEDGKIVGTAPKASFALFRTEDVASETRIEEANWLFAAEMADSLGVDVINSSLGYTQFDNSLQNYVYKNDLNGDKALITRAADWAAQVGILVCNSAGNDGTAAWKYIGAPADADSIITVGAVGSTKIVTSFSSYGPSADGRTKPELAAQGGSTVVGTPSNTVGISSGTSFSSPLMAGFVASFWGAFPELTNMQVREYLIRSASQYDKPDDRIGYGIPNFEKAYNLVEYEKLLNELKKQGLEVAVFPNPFDDPKTLKIWILKEETGDEFRIELFDNIGKEILSFTTKDKFTKLPIQKTDLFKGNYILKVSSENLNFSKRLWFE